MIKTLNIYNMAVSLISLEILVIGTSRRRRLYQCNHLEFRLAEFQLSGRLAYLIVKDIWLIVVNYLESSKFAYRVVSKIKISWFYSGRWDVREQNQIWPSQTLNEHFDTAPWSASARVKVYGYFPEFTG